MPQEISSMPEQWQLTLDVIKSKAQTLLIENNGLVVKYQQLVSQAQEIKQAISIQQNKNEQMSVFLSQRHGRGDQQLRIEELSRIVRMKKQDSTVLNEKLTGLTKKKSLMDQNIQRLKYAISDIELHNQAQQQKIQTPQGTTQAQSQDQLTELRKQLEEANKQEVLLENQLGALKTGDKTQHLNVDAVEEENRKLEAQLDILRLQKLHHEKQSSDTTLAQANARMYGQLRRRKEQLEASIYAYEMRMDQLRESSLVALSWPLKKKRLVHEMVQKDAHNNQMRDKIKDLREDIEVLRDQVAKLERRVDFSQGKNQK
jgi:hypothetical protein